MFKFDITKKTHEIYSFQKKKKTHEIVTLYVTIFSCKVLQVSY